MTDRPTCDKCLKVHGLLTDIKNAVCEAKGEIRLHFLAAHDLWYSTVHHYQAKIQQYDRSLRDRLWPCDEIQQVLFWLYATLLFGGSVCYFLWRILTYKCGWLEFPQLNI